MIKSASPQEIQSNHDRLSDELDKNFELQKQIDKKYNQRSPRKYLSYKQYDKQKHKKN